jgi:SNF family Na+-dependent transporter
VDDIVTDGPGLVFVVFPHALSKMPLPQLWSVVFFGMLILLGIDSQVKLQMNIIGFDIKVDPDSKKDKTNCC